jgi:hypothetical protein
MFGIAISSRIYNTIGSKKRPAPEEIPPFLAYDLAKLTNNNNINNATTIMVSTPLVIEKSSLIKEDFFSKALNSLAIVTNINLEKNFFHYVIDKELQGNIYFSQTKIKHL